MDNTHYGRRRGQQYRRRKNDFTYWDKSSSEPDLTDHTSNYFSSRWKQVPQECITVDELKFFRRRRHPGSSPSITNANQTSSTTTDPTTSTQQQLLPLQQQHTSSSFSLYNKSEPYIPFSVLKTEYQRQYCTESPDKGSPRPAPLLRRSSSLKLTSLGITDDMPTTPVESEQHSEFHAYTNDEMSKCRRSLSNRPDTLGNSFDTQQPQLPQHPDVIGQSVHFDGNVSFMSEPHFDAKQKIVSDSKLKKHASQVDHLSLSGELQMNPEYRSQFVTFPIGKSQSVPQISNIQFQGKFTGIAEYRDSFREYDHYAKSAAIRKPDHLTVKGAIMGGDGDNAEKSIASEKSVALFEKSVSAKKSDTLRLPSHMANRQAEYSDQYKDQQIISSLPKRGKPRSDFLSLNGKMEYSPEYRSTYLNFPRHRPVAIKPKPHFRLGDSNQLNDMDYVPINQPFVSNLMTRNMHEPNGDNVAFMSQPEVRRAKQDLLIKERIGRKDVMIHQPAEVFVANSLQQITSPEAKHIDVDRANLSSQPLPSHTRRSSSPTFKLTVKNVDDPGGNFKRTTPRFGRRSIVGGGIKEAHRLRNRTKVVEGNREYSKETRMATVHQSNVAHQHTAKRSPVDPHSFVVLKEPSMPSNWMKSSWYA